MTPIVIDKEELEKLIKEANTGKVLPHIDSHLSQRIKQILSSAQSADEIRKNLIEVIATKDDSGHWYVIPKDLHDDFVNDLTDEEMGDSGQFDNKYGQYRTGGNLNLVQLYAKL